MTQMGMFEAIGRDDLCNWGKEGTPEGLSHMLFMIMQDQGFPNMNWRTVQARVLIEQAITSGGGVEAVLDALEEGWFGTIRLGPPSNQTIKAEPKKDRAAWRQDHRKGWKPFAEYLLSLPEALACKEDNS